MPMKGRVAVVVLDGFGLIPATEWNIVRELFHRLPEPIQARVIDAAGRELAECSLAPTSHGVARILARGTGRPWRAVFDEVCSANRRVIEELRKDGTVQQVTAWRCEIAAACHYAPWALETPFLFRLRQEQPTWITRTAGVFTGFDATDPEIMGNSDTGHQQIFNLCVARQIPAAISALVESGEFFRNEALNRDLLQARDGAVVVLKTLLSGEFGDDGYVHSAFPHLLAFLHLYFEVLGLPASQLQVEAVLDGRDSPLYSSLRFEEIEGRKRYGYLHKLRSALARYRAEGCLVWILGRQFMDRDYKGGMIRKEYELVTGNVGRRVADFDEALALVATDHEAGTPDPSVEPIVIGNPTPVGNGTVLFNAIFRADRQEPISACLLGCTDFIRTQATQKKRLDSWGDFTWFGRFDKLTHWSMIDYHLDFRPAGALSVYHDSPHEHNVLARMTEKVPGFRFLFLTEGVKEKHMGLFSRGRRSRPLAPAETQVILPSCGRDQGVQSDNDLFKQPAMRHPEIALRLESELRNPAFDLLAVNFPGADMIGHLVIDHFDACLKTIESLDAALSKVVPAATENGWVLVVTSDHGNVEHFGPDHGNNDVLTSLILPPGSDLVPRDPPDAEARLFDVAWTALAALGIDAGSLELPPWPPRVADSPFRLVGVPLAGGGRRREEEEK